jgi:rod shape-determining protein MreD
MLPWGRFIAAPDFVALILVFWGVHQPRKVGIGTAFCLGLLMDVHDAALLGGMRWPTRCCPTLPSCCTAGSCGSA